MPKRKLEDELDEDWQENKVIDQKGMKKNSLDSDEDESDTDDKQYQILASDDIEGQEEGTAQFDGNVRITPFNMKEEMEEGHFDVDGHYHFNKEAKGELKDNWLDNIDWVKVKKTEDGDGTGKSKGDASSSDEDETPFDQISAYSKILKYLQPGESVAKALRRLGGGVTLTASQKLKLKKQGIKPEDLVRDATSVLALTELANGLLNATGNMDVYQETYEQISRTIKASETKLKTKPKVNDDMLDMYADDFDEKEKARLTNLGGNESNKEETSKPEEKPSSSQDLAGVQEVAWEFKWSDDNEEIHGPHTSMQMQQWVNEGYFKDSVCVRKVGTDGNFYSCRRVDFELYI